MAKKNRYHQLETLMTEVIIGVSVLFVMFVLFSWFGIGVGKYITGILEMIVSLLSLGWLYITGEFKHRRSLWMITAFICFIICTLVSMLLGYPCPPLAAI